MEAIKRIISRKQFKLYNIPDNFGDEAEMIIIPINKFEEENKKKTGIGTIGTK